MPDLHNKKDHFTNRYMDQFNTKGKFTTAKAQLFFSAMIFLAVLIFVGYMYISGKISSAYDIAALVTMISVSGAIFGSSMVWYSKKSASEDHYQLRMALYHDSARVRLNYNEAMFKLMKKYNMTQADLDKVDESGNLDEMMEDAMNNTVSGLDSDREDAESKNELEVFTI